MPQALSGSYISPGTGRENASRTGRVIIADVVARALFGTARGRCADETPSRFASLKPPPAKRQARGIWRNAEITIEAEGDTPLPPRVLNGYFVTEVEKYASSRETASLALATDASALAAAFCACVAEAAACEAEFCAFVASVAAFCALPSAWV